MTKKTLIPAPGFILVEPLEFEKATPSGIILPENVEEKPLKGRVIKVGETLITDEGKVDPWAKIKSGTTIVYKKWAGNEYRPEGADKDLLFVKFEDVLAIES